MKAIVTAVHDNGARWGWPNTSVFRYRGQDGSWAWVPQPPGYHHTVGEIIDLQDGWEWLDDDVREKTIAAIGRLSAREQEAALKNLAESMDELPRKKTPAQIQREIDDVIGKGRGG